MPALFPPWTNTATRAALIGAVVIGAGALVAPMLYARSPYATGQGDPVLQPIAFDHRHHVRDDGIDCAYCHYEATRSPYAGVPPTSLCMNCHSQVLKDDPKLALVRESYATGKPIPWVQIHKLPDFVYFNHSVHVNRGVSCVECHGQINKMDEVHQDKPLSMSFCLNCHRDPAAHIRPEDKVTDLGWKWSPDSETNEEMQVQYGTKYVHDWKVQSLQDCSACHR